MNQNKKEIGAAIPTKDMIEFLIKYADSGLPLERWQMVLGIANRLRYLDAENKRLQAQYEALIQDAKSAGPDICNICKHSTDHADDCDCDCNVCDHICACKECRKWCNFEWRGEA